MRTSAETISLAGLSRRQVLHGLGLAAGALLLPRRVPGDEAYRLPAATRVELEKSPLVYVSPLRSAGEESRCHGEVWYFVDGEDVVIVTGAERWKARALDKGLDRARVWVGDLGRGRFKGERFREGPTFLARGSLEKDPTVFERLLAAFGRRYAEEWGKWESRFREGYAEGSRVVIRYRPIAP
jgi:hypothetical protein